MQLGPINWVKGKVMEARLRRRAVNAEAEEYERRLNRIAPILARSLALRRLAEDADFFCEEALISDVLPTEMPDSLQELFAQYRSVNWIGIAMIGLDDWEPCPGLDGFYLVGTDTEEALVSQLSTDLLHIYRGGNFTSTYQSVYHWILALGDYFDPAAIPE